MKPLLILGVCLLVACTSNTPFRDDQVATCDTIESCSSNYYELHPSYEIGFVEYSERGNDFDPARTKQMVDRLKQYSASGKLAMVVFIHGWKHNADQNDENVVSFTKALANLSASGVLNDRKLVGIYVGWRGLSLHGLGSENATYWDRKSVAEEVGRGGVTELLSQLEQIDRSQETNYLVIVGHSFGGAITLSALHDQLLERLQNQQAGLSVRAFGDAVIMLNPAIEANQGLLLKENSLKVGASGARAQSLLYVISSQGDEATHYAFPLGQWLGVNLSWSQVDLKRTYNGQTFTLREKDMDTTAIGNYSLYHTTKVKDPDRMVAMTQAAADDSSTVTNKAMAGPKVLEETKFGDWELVSYCTPDGSGGDPELPRMPCYSNEPVSFIYTADSFIDNHNDIFNPAVIAFMSTAVSKAIYERTNGQSYFDECLDNTQIKFSFSSCFSYHFTKAKQTDRELERFIKNNSSTAYPNSGKQKPNIGL